MKKKYVDIPLFTTLDEIIGKDYTLSATQYKSFNIPNKNVKPVSDFLYRDLGRNDLGNEVGSENYVENSPFSFIKTKALQEESFLLDDNKEAITNITPQSYIEYELKQGDLLISKDSNVGEIVILDRDYPNAMLCGGIYKLPIIKNKYYLLAFIKSELFRQQIDFLVPRGSTIRHGKKKFLECLIPFPNSNEEKTIEFVEIITKAIINKEIEIRKKYQIILDEIQAELEKNQRIGKFKHTFPTISEILNTTRLDSSLYSNDFKKEEFLLDNYNNGVSNIYDLGFDFIRGNNLALTVIGESIYSDKHHKGFYTLIVPKNMSKYGTLSKTEYLGNKNNLLTLKRGSIVFGAEGTFRSIIFMGDDNAITNFHGLTVYNKEGNLQKSIFVKLMLDYFREHGICKACATGGNGGSLSIEYWKYLKFPNFPKEIEEKIVKQYHNPLAEYKSTEYYLNNFFEYDNKFNQEAGIYELDKSIKYLQDKLNKAIDDIANDRVVEISF